MTGPEAVCFLSLCLRFLAQDEVEGRVVDLNTSLGASSIFSKMLPRGKSSVQSTAELHSCGCLATAHLFLLIEKKGRKTHMEMRLHSFLLSQLISSLYAWPIPFPK